MCRMMAVVGSRASAAQLVTRFRAEAHVGRVGAGMAPGHKDGWGIVFADAEGQLCYAGRSTLDAVVDDEYPRAVARLGAARGTVLAHVRKASLGSRKLDNTHPFIEEGLALAHNGTVWGYAPEGENDSRALFAAILAERRKGASVEDALSTLARDVDARCRYSSLTLLLTDGRSAWGLRRIGNDPAACAPEACAPDYYTLGHAKLPDGTVVLSQEHEVLHIDGWRGVADGDIITVAPTGHVTMRSAL
ncbi:MAG: class II glutamine amidotransferase [Candidatus Thermoplasmatota archaeon]